MEFVLLDPSNFHAFWMQKIWVVSRIDIELTWQQWTKKYLLKQ